MTPPTSGCVISRRPASPSPVCSNCNASDGTPASSDGAPGNSAHDQSPGDVASEAHADNPSSEDDVHANSGEAPGHNKSTESESTPSTESHSNNSGGNGSGLGGLNSSHSSSAKLKP